MNVAIISNTSNEARACSFAAGFSLAFRGDVERSAAGPLAATHFRRNAAADSFWLAFIDDLDDLFKAPYGPMPEDLIAQLTEWGVQADDTLPVFSESFLYPVMGKDTVRTLLYGLYSARRYAEGLMGLSGSGLQMHQDTERAFWAGFDMGSKVDGPRSIETRFEHLKAALEEQGFPGWSEGLRHNGGPAAFLELIETTVDSGVGPGSLAFAACNHGRFGNAAAHLRTVLGRCGMAGGRNSDTVLEEATHAAVEKQAQEDARRRRAAIAMRHRATGETSVPPTRELLERYPADVLIESSHRGWVRAHARPARGGAVFCFAGLCDGDPVETSWRAGRWRSHDGDAGGIISLKTT